MIKKVALMTPMAIGMKVFNWRGSGVVIGLGLTAFLMGMMFVL
jgi:hypothetical protein